MQLGSSDEDEPLSAGSGMAAVGSTGGSVIGGPISPCSGNGLGQESPEEEGLYQFRRSKATHYHRVSKLAHYIIYNMFMFNQYLICICHSLLHKKWATGRGRQRMKMVPLIPSTVSR